MTTRAVIVTGTGTGPASCTITPLSWAIRGGDQVPIRIQHRRRHISKSSIFFEKITQITEGVGTTPPPTLSFTLKYIIVLNSKIKIICPQKGVCRTSYKILSLACRGGPPPCRRGKFCRMFRKLIFQWNLLHFQFECL